MFDKLKGILPGVFSQNNNRVAQSFGPDEHTIDTTPLSKDRYAPRKQVSFPDIKKNNLGFPSLDDTSPSGMA